MYNVQNSYAAVCPTVCNQLMRDRFWLEVSSRSRSSSERREAGGGLRDKPAATTGGLWLLDPGAICLGCCGGERELRGRWLLLLETPVFRLDIG